MAFDLTRSYFNDIRERAVADGQEITEEGQLVVYVDAGDGTLAVQPSDATTGQLAAGFAITDALKFATRTVVEELVIPAGGGEVSLSNTNIVAGSERVFNVTDSSAMTQSGSPTTGQYDLTDSTGVIEFASADAGDTVRVTYRYNVTLEEQLATEHERSINNRAQDLFSSVSVGCMEGEIFTNQYDTSQAYAVGDTVYAGASGRVTSDNTSAVVVGIVSQVPSVSDGLLGVKYSGLQ